MKWMNFSIKSVLKAIIEIIKSIARGDTLLRMRVDKLFPYILCLFILGWVSIWMNIETESAMHKVEVNKEKIEMLKIENIGKTSEMVRLTRITTVEDKLNALKSEVKAPEKPAFRIKK